MRRIAGGSDSASAMTGILAAATGGPKLASLSTRTKPLFNITDLMNQDEWNAYHEQVTPWEVNRYLTLF